MTVLPYAWPRRRVVGVFDLDEVGFRHWVYRLVCVLWFTIPWAGVVKVAGGATIARAIGAVVAVVAAVAVIKSGLHHKLNDFIWLVVAFVVWVALSDVWSVSPPDTRSRIFTFAQLAVMVALTWEFAPTRSHVLGLMKAWILGSFVLASIIFYGFVQNTSLRRYTVGENHPGDLAGAMLMSIVLAWYLSFKTRRPQLVVAYRLFVIYAIGAVVLTASRAALLTLPVALLIVPLTVRVTSARTRLAMFAVLIAATVAVPLFATAASGPIARLGTTQSEISSGTLDNRTTVWGVGFKLLSRNPWVGVGANASAVVVGGQYRGQRQLHNTLMTIGVELGVVGLALFLLVVLAAAWRAVRATPWLEQRMALVLLAVYIVQLMPRSADHAKSTWAMLVLFALIGETMVRRRHPPMVRAVP